MEHRSICTLTTAFLLSLALSACSLFSSVPAEAAPCDYAFSYYSSGVKKTVSGTDGNPITFVNRSNQPIWLGILGDHRDPVIFTHGFEGPSTQDPWKIPAYDIGNHSASRITWCAPKVFASSRIWPRTGCKIISIPPITIAGQTFTEKFWCETGDCDRVAIPARYGLTDHELIAGYLTSDRCEVSSTAVSVAEFTFNKNSEAYYDVSFVDGYNFPIVVAPAAPSAACKVAGCDGTAIPDTCVTGDYQKGTCLAPYLVYLQDPANKYKDDYYAVSAKCADPRDICDCAYTCDGKDGRSNKDNCPDTYTTENKYSTDMPLPFVTLHSSACSPINEYSGIINKVIGDTSSSMWKQIVCDPLTGFGGLYTPYFDDGRTAQSPPLQPPSSTWSKGDIFSFDASTIPGFTGISGYTGTIDRKNVAVFVKKNTTTGIPAEDTPVYPVNISIAGTVITVTLDSTKTSNIQGTSWPVTVTVSNPKYTCNPWPAGTEQYATTLYDACPDAYSFQYNDKGGLGKCTAAEVAANNSFTITFHQPKPGSATDSSDPIQFRPGSQLKINLLRTRAGSLDKRVVAIANDFATMPLKANDSVSLSVNCDTATSVTCNAAYNGKGADERRTFTTAATEPAYCKLLFDSLDQHMLTIGIDPSLARQYCTDPTQPGDSLLITTPATYETDISSLNFTGTVTAKHDPFSIKIPDMGHIDLKVYCDTEKTRSVECKAVHSSSSGFQNITGSYYCYKTNAVFNSPTRTLVIPDPSSDQECFAANAVGDQFMVFPSPNAYGTLISVPGNGFEITRTADTPFSIRIPIGSVIYMKAFCNSDKTSAGVCQATYDGNNTFKDIAGDFCQAVFGKSSGTYTTSEGRLPLPASGDGTCHSTGAFLKNETDSSLYYGTLQTALAAAAEGDTVRALAMSMIDAGVTFSTGRGVVFHGGYTALADATATAHTTISAPLKVRSGRLGVNRLIVR